MRDGVLREECTAINEGFQQMDSIAETICHRQVRDESGWTTNAAALTSHVG